MQITKLSQSKWQTFKTFWLDALKTEPSAFFNLYIEQINEADTNWEAKFSDLSNTCFAAISDSNIVGLAGYQLGFHTKTRHVATLIRLYVSPAFRRQGIATQLIQSIITELQTFPQIVKLKLDVVSTQKAAINLYRKFGFKKVGLLKKELFSDGKYYDEILMEMMI